jgi:hypothetical protein
MMMTMLLFAGCLLGALLLLTSLGVVIFLVMQARERDSISTARQDWIQRRSEKDEREW